MAHSTSLSEEIRSKPVLLIVGAAGANGTGTIEALTRKYPEHYTIRAGVRSAERAAEL